MIYMQKPKECLDQSHPTEGLPVPCCQQSLSIGDPHALFCKSKGESDNILVV